MHMKTAAVAGLLGLSARRINQLVEEGIAVRVDKTTIDAAATIQAYIAHVSGKATGAEVGLNLDRESARLKKEQADGHEIKNAQTRGELLQADDVERTWADALRRVRSGMLAVTGRVRQQIDLPLADAAIIDREIRDALSALSGGDGDSNEGAAQPSTTTETQTI
ncbi:MAG: hypothetical protein ACOH2N_11260 [Devosia sp.]